MLKPNFLFIGPDKTGSSWLFSLLQAHPQCFVPECKDIYFFDRYYQRGMAWYLDFFQEAKPHHLAVGELSHDYMFSSEALERISNDLPNVKLLTCLRNPIDRSFSHYLYLVRSGLTKLPFREALTEFPEILEHSLYWKYLSPWFAEFGIERIKVLWFEMLRDDPEKFANECLQFLGVTTEMDFNFRQKVRVASKPRVYVIAKAMKAGANFARRVRMEKLVGRIKHSRVSSILYKPYSDKEKPKLSELDRKYLKDFFSEDIQKLESLLGVRLRHWLNGGDT